MPRTGNQPRLSTDLEEERVVYLRIKGELFNLLCEVTDYLDISHNRFIIQTMTSDLNKLKDKIDKEKKKK